ncbi:hypothetical protein M433DRAFT_221481 [Acidomyces richmondensis BFW]|nr:hypothetical protein M433DRAFT_221481 [Acidomyces richmondensis BFW]
MAVNPPWPRKQKRLQQISSKMYSAAALSKERSNSSDILVATTRVVPVVPVFEGPSALS